MELIETNFDKTHVSQCATRCFQAYHRHHLSPDESHCLQQCARTVLKNQKTLLTMRPESKQLPLCVAQI